MVALIKRHWLFVLALVVVVTFWGACFGVSWLRISRSSAASPMETYGQFGDTFGTVNALFTGLALIGVAYTIRLQIDQNQAQRQELDRQNADAEESHRAVARQKRKQFLTARLNATIALLQAAEVRANLANTQAWREFEFHQAARESTALRQRISMLLHEVAIGFDRDWDFSLERDAIREHLISTFINYILAIRDIPEGSRAQYSAFLEPNLFREIQSFCNLIRRHHHRVSGLSG